ncbi:MAG: S8 family serine peptidase [Archangium sp.]|nr:S8 family serine peptidase [Archangium sp.]
MSRDKMMLQGSGPLARLLGTVALVVAHAALAGNYTFPPKTAAATVSSETHSLEHVVIKFMEGSRVSIDDGHFVATHSVTARDTVFRTRYGLTGEEINAELFSLNGVLDTYGAVPRVPYGDLSAASLDAMRDSGEAATGDELGSLALYFIISRSFAQTEMRDFRDALSAFAVVEVAYAMPKASEPIADIPPTTPVLAQTHLASTFNYDFANGIAGGRGAICDMYDVETAATFDHEDMPFSTLGTIGISMWLTSPKSHGTAVMGILVADDSNGIGVKGVVPEARAGLASPVTPLTVFLAPLPSWPYSPAQAIGIATDNLLNWGRPDRTLLIEQQFPPDPAVPLGAISSTCGGECGKWIPVETYSWEFTAIKTAVANGIRVVEAAANGGVNLDHSYFANTLTRESGAILVGAGVSTSNARSSFSNFGNRVRLQGWGDSVATLGYGDLWKSPSDPGDQRQWYKSFSGTSSATPMIAGALCIIQGVATELHGGRLTESDLMRIIRVTGEGQTGNLAEPIGFQPNLRRAIEHIQLIPFIPLFDM